MWWHTVTHAMGSEEETGELWVASTLYTTSEHGVSSITTADAHTSAASIRLNWRPRGFKWTRPFRRKTKSGICACAITFQMQSTNLKNVWHYSFTPHSILVSWRLNKSMFTCFPAHIVTSSLLLVTAYRSPRHLLVSSSWDLRYERIDFTDSVVISCLYDNNELGWNKLCLPPKVPARLTWSSSTWVVLQTQRNVFPKLYEYVLSGPPILLY